ncbi:glycosyltransferase family 2 protein [Lutimonas zeaxanthinifaciens]|uniref:glycosyltransferase family 2 protein n=1 Tax=Lutimonas zeaxanthinifaciens TaxID=3060215 RepID=UPI00265D1C3F|nr:glycosyltransferase [Lutimonas sp. YSD2104]WKK65615.1 glycosyltransferase [Lutimonas sp. YSD2104]
MIFAGFVIAVLYGILILYLSQGIDRLPSYKLKVQNFFQGFSIIIPFRNEAHNLPNLLESLNALKYPKENYEIILVNDSSTDNSVAIVQDFLAANPYLKLKLIEQKEVRKAPKKEAIKKAIEASSLEWIITTDADCTVPAQWLQAYNQMINTKDTKMIVAPVTYEEDTGFLHHFQVLDFLSLQGTTMGSFGQIDKGFLNPFLCNGANLCYSKDAFKSVDGFKGNDHVPSGDDVFLLEKFQHTFRGEVHFLKSYEAIVKTSSQKTWKALLAQRVRWASKTSAYNSLKVKMIGLLVLAYSLALIILFLFGFAGKISWGSIGLLFLIKFNLDFFLIFKTSKFFRQTNIMRSYFISSLIHPVYTVVVGLFSLKKNYRWKERSYG